jgi:eukaryotic-like serine/threonine-protein kinase
MRPVAMGYRDRATGSRSARGTSRGLWGSVGYRKVGRMLVAQRYRLSESIGRGGMGQVWRATDEALGRPVAVKLLHRHGATDEQAAERFRLEAHAAAVLSDPHVVAVYDFGHHDDTLFLVMELVEGRSLADELRAHGAMAPGPAADIIKQAAAGLSAAHRQGVIHRDVKPGNLLLALDGTVKIADFGIARLVAGADKALTNTGEIAGTSHYLAPERAKGRPGGPEADVYALGCVLYQLVTGHPPFYGDTPVAVAYQHVDTDPVPPGELRPALAGTFERFLLQMLAKDPTQRPTAEQIALWDSASTQTLETGAADEGIAEAVETVQLHLGRTSRGHLPRSTPAAVAAAAVSAVATAGVVAMLVDHSGAVSAADQPGATNPSTSAGPVGPVATPSKSPKPDPVARPSQQVRQVITPGTWHRTTDSRGTDLIKPKEQPRGKSPNEHPAKGPRAGHRATQLP